MRLASSAPSRSSSRVSWPLLGSIAAAVLIVLVMQPTRHQSPLAADHERAADVPAVDSRVVATINDQLISRQNLRLVWRRDTAAVGYRVIVTDSAGAPVWRSDDLTDTSTAPPSSVVLSPGARYFWRVDALHTDGSAAQSATFGFRITP